MGLKPRFTEADIAKATLKGLLEIENNIVQMLKITGEQFVKQARTYQNIASGFDKGQWQVDTGNLTASIGFVVLKDGIMVVDGLDGDKPEGVQAAKDAIARIPKRDYQLIGVAGMDYASHLEAMGYNVITSQATYALVDLEKLSKKLVKRYNDRKGINLDYDFDYTGVSSELR
jgi:hypothetical protein